jgi:F0F1-type ATP synthase membrane subunit b/b'
VPGIYNKDLWYINSQHFHFGIKKENSLAELEKLRREAQKFTTTALKKLDLLQAKILEKRAQEAKNIVASDGKKYGN